MRWGTGPHHPHLSTARRKIDWRKCGLCTFKSATSR